MRRLIVIASCLVPTIAASEPRPDDVAPVIAATQARLAKYRSVQYTIRDHGLVVEDAGLLDSRMTSPVIAARVGGRVRVRLESSRVSRYYCKHAGCSEAAQGADLIEQKVFDGRVLHAYLKEAGSEAASRRKMAAAPLFTLLELGDLFTTGDAVPVRVTRAPDVVLGGKTMHVLVRTVGSRTVQLYFIERDTGLIHTEVGITGPSFSVRTYTDVTIDAPVPARTFVFVPPPGVTVSDLDASSHAR